VGRVRGPYQEEFPVGSWVKVADREVLERFRGEWRLHHPLELQQLEFAGRVGRVSTVGFYHGADELYTLAGIPGTWHEQLIMPASPARASMSRVIPVTPRLGRATHLGGWLVALVVSGAGAYLVFLGLMFVGAITGVVAMCATAGEWWVFTWFGLLVLPPPAGGALAGLWVRRRLLAHVLRSDA